MMEEKRSSHCGTVAAKSQFELLFRMPTRHSGRGQSPWERASRQGDHACDIPGGMFLQSHKSLMKRLLH